MTTFIPWPRLVFLALELLWMLCGTACLTAALAAVYSPAFARDMASRADRWDRAAFWRRPATVLTAGLALAVFGFKAAQYARFQLTNDAAIMGNLDWNLLHGYGFTSSIISGQNYFTVHFAFTMAAFAPLLFISPHILTLALVQSIAVGSIVGGAYLLGRRRYDSGWSAGCLALLVWAHPLFHELILAVIDNSVFAAAFFVWGIYCWETGARRTAVVFAVLLLTCRELAPFLLAGLGLMLLVRAERPRTRALGAALAIAAAGLWFLEMWIIGRARANVPQEYWSLYDSLGGSPQGVWRTALHTPWLFAKVLVVPIDKWRTPLRVFAFLAFLPLAAGAGLIPALTVWIPQQLAHGAFQNLLGHYAAFVAGPLFWASAQGLERILRAAKLPRRLIAACLLATAGISFFNTANFLPDEAIEAVLSPWPNSWRAARLQIPPDAKVWSDSELMDHLSMRHDLRPLPYSTHDPCFKKVFMPDRIIVTRRWLALAEKSAQAPVLAFIEKYRFSPVYQDASMTVLALPLGSANVPTPGAEIPWPAAAEKNP